MTGREYPDVRVWQSTPLARHYFLLVFLPFIPQFVSPSFGSERIDEWLEAVMFASRKHAICSPFVQLFPTRSFLSVPFLDFSTMIYALSVWLRKEGWGRDLMNGCKNRSRDGKHINWVDLHNCSLLVFVFFFFFLLFCAMNGRILLSSVSVAAIFRASFSSIYHRSFYYRSRKCACEQNINDSAALYLFFVCDSLRFSSRYE